MSKPVKSAKIVEIIFELDDTDSIVDRDIQVEDTILLNTLVIRSLNGPIDVVDISKVSPQMILGSLSLHTSWTKDETIYLRKRLDDLIRVSVVVGLGCIRSNTCSDDNPFYRLSLVNVRGKTIMYAYKFVMSYQTGIHDCDRQVLHMCKTKGCFNPNHLELGTASQNSLDKIRDGTSNAKLTPDEAIDIYNDTSHTRLSLSEKYGVHISTIDGIKNGVNWWTYTGATRKIKSKTIREEAKKYILENPDECRQRIIKKVNVVSESNDSSEGCFEWQGAKDSGGYGNIVIKNNAFGTHIVMWSIKRNRFPIKCEIVRHMCDNPCCCNPDHLEIGSRSDNAKDMKHHGESHHSAILTDEQVAGFFIVVGVVSATMGLKFH